MRIKGNTPFTLKVDGFCPVGHVSLSEFAREKEWCGEKDRKKKGKKKTHASSG